MNESYNNYSGRISSSLPIGVLFDSCHGHPTSILTPNQAPYLGHVLPWKITVSFPSTPNYNMTQSLSTSVIYVFIFFMLIIFLSKTFVLVILLRERKLHFFIVSSKQLHYYMAARNISMRCPLKNRSSYGIRQA